MWQAQVLAKNLQDFKASLQRKTTPQIDWCESSQEVLAARYRGELAEHAARYITTARKNLHDFANDLQRLHRQSPQSEPSMALQCLENTIDVLPLLRPDGEDIAGRSTARSENSDGDVLVGHCSNRADFFASGGACQ